MHKKIKKILNYSKNIVIEEYKFILLLLLIFIILQWPMNYYITTGGGTSDVSSRINVDNKYNSKGSFNISYVTQLEGTLLSYGLSYIIPTWERESTNNYKFDEEESINDIDFRSDLDLKTANSTATYWAYTLANKKIEETSSKLYVIATINEFDTKLKVKDEILSVDGKRFSTIDEYRNYLQTKNEDDTVLIKIKRNNKEKIITQNLFMNKNKKVLGVALQYLHEYKTIPPVKIKFKRSESGPSGGLITTLEIYNQLTKKDYTKGLKIAGTGTIEEDGTIGQIGGIEHKVLGAAKSKTDIFLSPSGENYKSALKYKKEKNLKIKIIEVKTIEDAINKLEEIK